MVMQTRKQPVRLFLKLKQGRPVLWIMKIAVHLNEIDRRSLDGRTVQGF